jgi:hypothetical protein
VPLEPSGEGQVTFRVRVGADAPRRRMALDVTIGDLRLGQHAEAIIDVGGSRPQA